MCFSFQEGLCVVTFTPGQFPGTQWPTFFLPLLCHMSLLSWRHSVFWCHILLTFDNMVFYTHTPTHTIVDTAFAEPQSLYHKRLLHSHIVSLFHIQHSLSHRPCTLTSATQNNHTPLHRQSQTQANLSASHVVTQFLRTHQCGRHTVSHPHSWPY